MDAMKLVNIDR